MRVSILTPDVSHNCLGRAHLLGELLSKFHDVEIVGPEFGDGVWSPVMDDYDYKCVKTGKRIYKFGFAVPELLKSVTGEVILVSKPRISSFGIGLLKKLTAKYPLILDIDDWEMGFHNNSSIANYLLGIPALGNVNSIYHTYFMEKMVRFADAKTVSNYFLKNRFGGELIPHVRNTRMFDPSRFSKESIRRKYGLPQNQFLVGFIGTPRPHKGVEDLVRAVSKLNRKDVSILLVGAHDSNYLEELRRIGGEKLIVRGQQNFKSIPSWIASTDIIAIPQKNNPFTWGQLPAKVFDAMAMGKPIIATDVSDLPTVLEGCGIIIKPESTSELEDAICKLLKNEKMRENLGERARKKSLEQYNHEVAGIKLKNTIERVVK